VLRKTDAIVVANDNYKQKLDMKYWRLRLWDSKTRCDAFVLRLLLEETTCAWLMESRLAYDEFIGLAPDLTAIYSSAGMIYNVRAEAFFNHHRWHLCVLLVARRRMFSRSS